MRSINNVFYKKDDGSKLDTRERIIKTTLNIIGEKGDVNPTIREIAQKAGVNLASINYYFRTKRTLFDEIEKYFTDETNNITRLLDDPDMEPVTCILNWAKKLMENLADYPGIMLILANKIIRKEKIEKTIVKFLNIRNAAFKKLIEEITGIVNDDELVDLKATQIFSGIINPLIIQYGAGRVVNIDFNDSKVRERYIETLIKSILGI